MLWRVVVSILVVLLSGCESHRDSIFYSPEALRPAFTMAETSDSLVCGYALTPSYLPLNWETHRVHIEYVQEAKRRGLTLEECSALRKRSVASLAERRKSFLPITPPGNKSQKHRIERTTSREDVRPKEDTASEKSGGPAAIKQRLQAASTTRPSLIPTNADLGRYHALVIGNNGYRSLPRLKTAVVDAKA